MSRYKVLRNGATDCECPPDFIHGHSQGDVIAAEAQVAKLADRIAALEAENAALVVYLHAMEEFWGRYDGRAGMVAFHEAQGYVRGLRASVEVWKLYPNTFLWAIDEKIEALAAEAEKGGGT